MSDYPEDEDFFIPVRLQEKLNGPASNAEHEEDIKYFREQLFRAIRVPKEYLNMSPAESVAAEDIRQMKAMRERYGQEKKIKKPSPSED